MVSVTKKMISDFLAESRSELNWCVISFDKATGRRISGYGSNEFFSAFCEITRRLRDGSDVILTNKEGWDALSKIENANHRRVRYDEMKPYEVVVDYYDHVRVTMPNK